MDGICFTKKHVILLRLRIGPFRWKRYYLFDIASDLLIEPSERGELRQLQRDVQPPAVVACYGIHTVHRPVAKARNLAEVLFR